MVMIITLKEIHESVQFTRFSYFSLV